MSILSDIIDHLQEIVIIYATPAIESLIVAAIGLLVYGLFCRTFNKLTDRGYFDYRLKVILSNVVKWLLITIVFLLSLGFFGVSVGTLWATLSGVLALVALGFVAVWSVLSNILCSILLITFSPFRIGDDIEIQEPTANFSVKGRVISINMLYTSLESTVVSESGEEELLVTRIPNNIFFQKYIRRRPGADTVSLKRYVASHQEK